MRVAVIGASGHYPYVLEGAFARAGLEIVAIAPGTPGEDMARLKAACAEKGFAPREYAWWEELLAQETIDIAAVNPWYCHSAAISMECLKRGVHVYSEKPLATTLRELDALEDVYAICGASLGAMYDGRHTSWLRTAKQAVAQGKIGSVRLLNGQKSYKMGTRGEVYHKIDSYGGMLAWIAIHPASWFDYILESAPVWVSAQTDDRENGGFGEMESTGCMLLRYPQGVLATINADFYRPDAAPRHDDDRIRITGTRGMIETRDGRVWLENEDGRAELEALEPENPFLFFVDAIGTPGARDQARTAFSTARACLLARESAQDGAGRWIGRERI